MAIYRTEVPLRGPKNRVPTFLRIDVFKFIDFHESSPSWTPRRKALVTVHAGIIEPGHFRPSWTPRRKALVTCGRTSFAFGEHSPSWTPRRKALVTR